MIAARSAEQECSLRWLMYGSHQLRLVVHLRGADRHVDGDLAPQLEIAVVPHDRLAGQHVLSPLPRHYHTPNQESGVIASPLIRNSRSFLYPREHLFRHSHELGFSATW